MTKRRGVCLSNKRELEARKDERGAVVARVGSKQVVVLFGRTTQGRRPGKKRETAGLEGGGEPAGRTGGR